MSASSSTTSQPPVPSSPPSAWRLRARCRSKALGGPRQRARRRPGRHHDDADPDGHGRVELTKFRNPELVEAEPAIAPPNTLGLRQIMFAVEDIDDTVAGLRAHGAELVGEVAQYEDKYRLCYMRGPAGIIVALAEELS
jgi:catechol 2,3-dioxygenase-like lactoylglutathione lyase family enzyme